MTVADITNRLIAKTNFLVGYQINDKVDAFLRVENNDFRQHSWRLAEVAQHFDTYKLDIVGKHDDKIKYGLEVYLSLFRPSSEIRLDKAHSMKDCSCCSMMIRKRKEPLRQELVADLMFLWPASSPPKYSRISQLPQSASTDPTSRTTKGHSNTEFNGNSTFDGMNNSFINSVYLSNHHQNILITQKTQKAKTAVSLGSEEANQP